MRKARLVMLLAVVSIWVASIAVAQSPSNNLRTLANTLSFKYVDCVTNWVGANLIATASPTEMADGGHSACQGELRAYEEAELKYLLSITPPGAQELGAITKARSLASDVRAMTTAHIVRLIIETRSGK